ncbi:glycoside hydrolase family 31 protein [Sphingobacterium sp. SGL-16]|uniref:glycoside hydrolase family 31 protein n=1 Tax=Sphingobacterium sp. SGL-16 TaxID=2710883 RepID=UPI0013EE32A3|nr:glycoside hydrolase family 31 protein [Sphingobacterium sp. SGL-16]NGM73184.1 glycoside hydrolase [Sphingobacterium sp. SGL-16]
MRSNLVLIVLFTTIHLGYSQSKSTLELPIGQDEYWWGGVVAQGSSMPFLHPAREYDLARENSNNQVVPLFVSNKGRFIWSDKPIKFAVMGEKIVINSDYEELKIQQSGNTLKSAYLVACTKYFPASGVLPAEEFFTKPQYNTWIELMYNQNQDDILKYAQVIVDNKFPTGVLMIDDNWQRYYGNFDFRSEKFPDPKGMIQKLHSQGFKVMLWICPFLSPDSPEYRELAQKGYLIKRKGKDEPAILNWWNGQSACYDLTNPAAFNHFVSILKKMQADYGIDGFKFDAGDNAFYEENLLDSYDKNALSVDHTLAWARLGLEFPFNEYRAGWKMGGQPLIQRLGDKTYFWNSVRILIPDMIAAGLLGYAYTCPDMIGGGEFTTFLNKKAEDFDQSLIVRSAQVHALMPMMQYSVAPWRILNKENLEIVRQCAVLHEKFGSYILDVAKQSSKTGEPILRHLEYEFPGQGFATVSDQFMLGEKYLVAPVVDNKLEREVKLPKGFKWKDDLGKIYKGGKTYKLDVPISRLLYFEKKIV